MKLNKKDIFSIIFFTLFFAGIYYMSGVLGLLSNLFSLVIFLLIYWCLYLFIKVLFRSETISTFRTFSSKFFFSISIVLLIWITFIWSFTYYYNEKSPAMMTKYTLSNWDKTVVFQSMMHIASENFYNYVTKDLKEKKDEWFIHFFEWVKWWTKENSEAFNKALGFEFDEKLYPYLSKLLWVTFQDYQKIIWQISDKDVNVDISMDEIMTEYNKIKKETSEKNTEVVKISEELEKSLNQLTERELKFVNYLSKAFLNLLFSSSNSIALLEWQQNPEIFSVILNKRNEVLANEIIRNPNKKIYVTYGALHFPGVFDLLKANDEKWKIISEEKILVLK